LLHQQQKEEATMPYCSSLSNIISTLEIIIYWEVTVVKDILVKNMV